MKLDNEALRSAWVKLLSLPEWSHFATFTFKNPVSLDYLNKAMRSYFRRVERMDGAIWWVYVAEATSRGQLHVHAVIGGTGHRSLSALERRWWLGICDVERYDHEQNGLWYITEELKRDNTEIMFSDNLPKIIRHALGETVTADKCA